MTSYLVALDERIAAAAPGCFITTSARKNESPGPGDAEQKSSCPICLRSGLRRFLVLAAPRPVQILAATRDYRSDCRRVGIVSRRQASVIPGSGFPSGSTSSRLTPRMAIVCSCARRSVRWMRRWLCAVTTGRCRAAVPPFSERGTRIVPRLAACCALPGARFDLMT